MASAWAVCEHSLIQTASWCVLYLSDLMLDCTHAPADSGPDSTMLAIILRKYNWHKDRFESVRVTGMWCHQDYLCCGTSMLAFSLFTCLFNDDTLNFYKSLDANESPMWQKFKLLPWLAEKRGETQAHKAYKSLLEHCGLKWEKVSHLQKLGIESASLKGCTEDEISTLSKHITRKIA